MNINISGSNNDLDAVAKVIGTTIEDDTIVIPDGLGSGYIKRFDFSSSMKMIIVRCVLYELVTFERHSVEKEEIISFGFRNVFHDRPEDSNFIKQLPSVFVSQTAFKIEFIYPANTYIDLIIIIIDVSLLKKMLYADESMISQLQPIFSMDKPFHFEEILPVEIKVIGNQLQKVQTTDPLSLFYCRVKAEEMIYLFFQVLLKRKDIFNYPFNNEDVKVIYDIRGLLIQNFSESPNLSELARSACMSESKMKKLFKQIFGKSIYNYYQYFRMMEAAYLIREKKFSVSQAGHHVGFTSLSHFTKVFEEHLGQKPKRYSKGI
ncbi:helix-turn-helix domain-containing protein [Pedobacter metabolipauper]|uniref:AraC family transcriptional regulator n=1 Tax=Pedobacter metabolipauper TaxID=425513 RepID=A0A4V3D1G5_9SPHI|nr:AraC family transcriptional regulator [Pedobacter metabolipauper]TDQ11023.1 AraC family transcriptional regulator [Pedobacter metabolipauper]